MIPLCVVQQKWYKTIRRPEHEAFWTSLLASHLFHMPPSVQNLVASYDHDLPDSLEGLLEIYRRIWDEFVSAPVAKDKLHVMQLGPPQKTRSAHLNLAPTLRGTRTDENGRDMLVYDWGRDSVMEEVD